MQKALERSELREENRALRAALPGGRTLIGSSGVMRELVEQARKVAESKSTVLLLGESGTGKEVLARSIHAWSPRAARPFIPVNCVALSEELLESELFGHEKGAFTGAHQQKPGKFELANNGTIFLDEVGDIRAALQTKLLRVLQEHEFERVGGTKTIRVDIRVIAATNRDLEEGVKAGRVPRGPLLPAERGAAAPAAAARAERGRPGPRRALSAQVRAPRRARCISGISPEAMALLRRHRWPGNVRELENAIERAVVLGQGPEIVAEDLGLKTSDEAAPSADAAIGPFHASVDAYKKDLIRRALDQAKGNQTRAAELLGLQRTYLARLIKTFALREGPA